MNLKIKGSYYSLEGAVLIITSILLSGCSSGVMRFRGELPPESIAFHQKTVQGETPQSMLPGAVESRALLPIPIPSPNPEAVIIDTPPCSPLLPASSARTGNTIPKTDRADQREVYIVQSGDTLYGISRRKNMSVDSLKYENRLSSNLIRIGQELIVYSKLNKRAVIQPAASALLEKPTTIQHKTTIVTPMLQKRSVDSGDPLKKETDVLAVAQKKQAIIADITAQEHKEQKKAVPVTVIPNAALSHMRWPARGHILSHYGQREGISTNDGIDIMIPEGTSVKAADSGVVIYAGDGLKEFGHTILIRHENNIVTVYGHNSRILVKRGQIVRRGDEIAKSGISGNASTPRLHFEVRNKSVPVDPLQYLSN